MNRAILKIIVLIVFASFCLSGFLIVRHILHLPFRSTNDDLHKRKSPVTLDFLIPAGTYLDEKMTIKDVAKIHFRKEKSFYEKMLNDISNFIPIRYQYLLNFILFFFLAFLFMTFFRVFTFMGYGRSLRGSLFLGGLAYFFMPDFSPGKIDDVVFIGIPLLIIIFRAYLHWKKKEKSKEAA